MVPRVLAPPLPVRTASFLFPGLKKVRRRTCRVAVLSQLGERHKAQKCQIPPHQLGWMVTDVLDATGSYGDSVFEKRIVCDDERTYRSDNNERLCHLRHGVTTHP